MSFTAIVCVAMWVLIVGWCLGYMSGHDQKKHAEARGWSVLETLSNGHNRPACRIIGAALEIEAEGGEDVGQYVEWACREAWIEEKKADLAFQMRKLDAKRGEA